MQICYCEKKMLNLMASCVSRALFRERQIAFTIHFEFRNFVPLPVTAFLLTLEFLLTFFLLSFASTALFLFLSFSWTPPLH